MVQKQLFRSYNQEKIMDQKIIEFVLKGIFGSVLGLVLGGPFMTSAYMTTERYLDVPTEISTVRKVITVLGPYSINMEKVTNYGQNDWRRSCVLSEEAKASSGCWPIMLP